VAGRPGAAGVHFLDGRSAARLVAEVRVGPGDLVLDLGAGLGAVTGPLAATGARVVANIPSNTTQALLRRLLDPGRVGARGSVPGSCATSGWTRGSRPVSWTRRAGGRS
jgi:hypothetical protein